jgi:hypothetical protein
MLRSLRLPFLILVLLLSFARPVWASFELDISISTPGAFSVTQLQELQHAIDHSKNLWESVITGYQSGINLTGISIVVASGSPFADASVTGSVIQGGFRLSTSGRVRVAKCRHGSYAVTVPTITVERPPVLSARCRSARYRGASSNQAATISPAPIQPAMATCMMVFSSIQMLRPSGHSVL